jgi:hypothetical protein
MAVVILNEVKDPLYVSHYPFKSPCAAEEVAPDAAGAARLAQHCTGLTTSSRAAASGARKPPIA